MTQAEVIQPQTPYRLQVLGSPAIYEGNQIIQLETRKALALFVYLAVEQKPIRRETLIPLFWPELDDLKGRSRLRRALWAIRKAIPGILESDKQVVSCKGSQILRVDAHQFMDLARADSAPPLVDSPDALKQALNLYQGEFLAGFSLPDAPAFDAWQDFQRQVWQSRLSDRFQHLSSHYDHSNQIDEAIAIATQWLTLDPTDELPHRQLMRLYVRNGNIQRALKQYEVCVRTLEQGLGVPPAPETEALYEQIMALKSSFTPPISDSEGLKRGSQQDLPNPVTPFIGREKELTQIEHLFTDPSTRMITIVGPGGMGKTRLALAVANASQEKGRDSGYNDGVFFIPLAPIQKGDQLPAAIANSLGLPLDTSSEQRTSPTDQLINYLRNKKMLIVLDNFEHLIRERLLVHQIIESTTGIQVLITSRESLNLQGEFRILLQGLDDEARSEEPLGAAIQLFSLVARRVRQDFECNEATEPYIRQISQRVDGMPLALELAATWIDLLSPADIDAEIEKGIDILSVAWADVPPRHQSMRALMESSWARLTSRARSVLAQLSIFRGGFTRSAAAEVTGASLADLASLRRKSLLQYDPRQQRYSIHELLRQFSAEKLLEDLTLHAEVSNRHLSYFSNLMQNGEDGLKDHRQRSTLDAIELNLENYDLAWDLAIDQMDSDALQPMIFPMGYFYEWRGRYEEGRSAMEKLDQALIDMRPNHPSAWAIKVACRYWLIQFNHLLEEAPAFIQSLRLDEMLESKWSTDSKQTLSVYAFALTVIGRIEEDTTQKIRALQQANDLYEEIGQQWESLSLSLDLAPAYSKSGNFEAALATYQRTMHENERFNDPRIRAIVSRYLSGLLMYTGQTEKSVEMARISRSNAEALGDPLIMARALDWLSVSYVWVGEFEKSARDTSNVISLYEELGRRWDVAFKQCHLSSALWAQGKYAEAVTAAQDSLTLFEELNDAYGQSFASFVLSAGYLPINEIEKAIALLERSIQIKRDFRLESELGWSFGFLAAAYLKQGRADLAHEPMVEGLTLGLRQPNLPSIFYGLLNMGLYAILISASTDPPSSSDQRVRLAELYGLVLNNPGFKTNVGFHDIWCDQIRRALSNLEEADLQKAMVRGAQHDIHQFAMRFRDELGL